MSQRYQLSGGSWGKALEYGRLYNKSKVRMRVRGTRLDLTAKRWVKFRVRVRGRGYGLGGTC